MNLKLASVSVGILLAAAGTAEAQNFSYGMGMKDRVAVPAPIPADAVAVPAPVPIPEGFTYYLRADLGWGFSGERSYSQAGRVVGGDSAPFAAAGAVATSGGTDATGDGAFLGTLGAGMYFSPRLRGDVTVDFRSSEELDTVSTYSYTSTTPATTVTGTIRNSFSLDTAAVLANLYWDLLPRGSFSPYVGAGVGFVYNDATRTYRETALSNGGPTAQTVTGSSQSSNVALAGALMAGATFAWNHQYAFDVGYRALYLGGIDISTPLTGGSATYSNATLGGQWEHQVRIGVRVNIW